MNIEKSENFKELKDVITKIADEFPCANCKDLMDKLNAAKSKLKKEVDAYEELKTSKEIPKWLVLKLFGGEFPTEDNGFAFDACSHWEIEDGRFIPFGGGSPAPGPNFKLIIDETSVMEFLD